MNEKILKNVNSIIQPVSRGKSTDKISVTKSIAQPVILNQSNSNKKLQPFIGN